MGIFKKKIIRNTTQFKKVAFIDKKLKIIDKVIINNKKKSQIKISKNVTIVNAKIFAFNLGKIIIGKYSYIGKDTQIDSCVKVEIGNYCMISNNVLIQDHNSHPVNKLDRRKQLIKLQDRPTNVYEAETKKIIIGDDVWIGTDSTILKGVTIGNGSIIAARAVVTKNVPPNSIAAGNPAIIVKKINQR